MILPIVNIFITIKFNYEQLNQGGKYKRDWAIKQKKSNQNMIITIKI